jgi:drug/metabolite transporter (DMT)-like permease
MAPELATQRWKVVVAFTTVAIVWGSTYFAIRVALDSFAPYMLAAIRFLVAGGLFYGYLRARGERAPTLREWGAAAITGGLFFVMSNGLVNVAEQSVSTGLASIVVATMPLWATLFARATGERVSGSEWLAIALGLVGVVVLNAGSELRAGGAGAVAAVLSPIAWALGSVVSRRLPLPRGPMCVAAQMITGGVGASIVSVVARDPMPKNVGFAGIAAVAYLVVFGSIIGFTAYTYLLRNTRAAIATSYAYVNPVVAVGLGVAFLGERLDPASGVGAAIILAAVLLVTRSKAKRAPTRSSSPQPSPAPAPRSTSPASETSALSP